MNDDLPPIAPEVDELASAYLDGELDPADRARVEADAGLNARAAQLGEIRDLVAAPVAPLTPDRREGMIRAALATAEAEDTSDGTGGRGDQASTASVVPLASRRRPHRVLRVLGPVAAAAAAIGAIAFLGRDTGDDDSGTAVRSERADQDATEAATILVAPATGAPAGATEAEQSADGRDTGGGAADSSVAGDRAGTEAPAEGAPLAALGPLPDLGEATTPEEVAELMRQRATEQESAPATVGARDANDTIAACAVEPGIPVAGVVYGGQRGLVVLTDDGGFLVLSQDCEILARVPDGS
jgi:Putative zinc-finger